MAIYHALISFPAANNLPKDTVTNSWNFDITGATPATEISSIASALVTFYNQLGSYQSPDILWPQGKIKWYAMADAKPRVPVVDTTFTALGTSNTTRLPAEVALCLSYAAASMSGQKNARRRGRVYIGPFNTTANDTATGRPTSSLLTTLVSAVGGLKSASSSAGGWEWGVLSQTPPGTMNLYPVTHGWIDNAWDTQRRRGNQPTARSLW